MYFIDFYACFFSSYKILPPNPMRTGSPKNPTPKQIYKTLKTKKNQAENANILPDIEILNNYFLSVGSLLSKKFKKHLQLSLLKCNQRLCS